MCDDSIVLPYGNFAFMEFRIMTGAIVLVAYFSGCIFAPESAIASAFLLGGFGGVPI